jgi:hypothetical protein
MASALFWNRAKHTKAASNWVRGIINSPREKSNMKSLAHGTVSVAPVRSILRPPRQLPELPPLGTVSACAACSIAPSYLEAGEVVSDVR